MILEENQSLKANLLSNLIQIVIYLGNLLTALGCAGLALGVSGVFDMNVFSIGLSSGVRIIGTVAIAGCLFSAIGYGVQDYLKN